MNFADAFDTASRLFSSRGGEKVVQANETKDGYIFFGGGGKFGPQGILIRRDTGEVSPFILPDRENFEILKNSQQIFREADER